MHQQRVTYTVPRLTEERSVATLREADTQCLLLTGKLRLVYNMNRTSLLCTQKYSIFTPVILCNHWLL
jgi:hypothetical protein